MHEAAYRFVNHGRINAGPILRPHQDATTQRIRDFPVVLVAQDTGEVDLTKKRDRYPNAWTAQRS